MCPQAKVISSVKCKHKTEKRCLARHIYRQIHRHIWIDSHRLTVNILFQSMLGYISLLQEINQCLRRFKKIITIFVYLQCIDPEKKSVLDSSFSYFYFFNFFFLFRCNNWNEHETSKRRKPFCRTNVSYDNTHISIVFKIQCFFHLVRCMCFFFLLPNLCIFHVSGTFDPFSNLNENSLHLKSRERRILCDEFRLRKRYINIHWNQYKSIRKMWMHRNAIKWHKPSRI